MAVIVTAPSKATCGNEGVTTMAGVEAVPLTVCVMFTLAELKLPSPLYDAVIW
jgi:hypothetical protein